MLKGLIFDLDGVLADTARLHLAAWGSVAQDLGITLPAAAGDALRGRSREESLTIVLSYGPPQDYAPAERAAFAATKNDRYRQAIAHLTPKDLLPGIPRLLAQAKASGLTMAIASASKNAPAILERLSIAADFTGVVDPATLHRGKPDPEIFVKAQALLGLAAREVVSFEDASAGVAAIKAAGQFAVGIGDAAVLHQADLVVPSTAALDLAAIRTAFGKSVS
ncbi:beta-phosphoglucomutase [Lacticaseibacillus parakribbianus]|uniref:beta-phosphoglucomutase n=1 Tax=Lacticaseibacillus parakribbianus TaxID=2970927 RepID=UPI0021CB68CF|nr:beta-phosphoglucomutase [Lacticaseibacillus parakribbianus]